MKRSKAFNIQSLYGAAWQQAGPGVLIALMFTIIASSTMFHAQSPVNASVRGSHADLTSGQTLLEVISAPGNSVTHTVRVELPMHQLRDAEGQLTTGGESFFMLLARRIKSLSLDVTLTVDTSRNVEFAAMIAARMMNETNLESTQLRIGIDDQRIDPNTENSSRLVVAIAMHETVAGVVE